MEQSGQTPKNYLEELYELRKMLKVLLRKEFLTEIISLAEQIDDSFVQRYVEICEQSAEGHNCGYAARAKTLFLQLQEADISKKIEYIFHTFIEEKR